MVTFFDAFVLYVCLFTGSLLLADEKICEVNSKNINSDVIFEEIEHPSQQVLKSSNWFDKEKLAVSLGYNCIVASQLNNEQIRHCAFPFDWCESSMEGICNCIKNDFNNFLCIENIQSEQESRVLDSLYNIKIVHDFPFQRIKGFAFDNLAHFYNLKNFKELVESQYIETYAKFLRRIKRFRKLSIYKGKIYFIRFLNITKEQSLELLAVLNDRFKASDFLLIVINTTEEFKDSWNIPKLKNFFVPSEINFHPFDKGLFTEIFKNVGLI